MEILNLEHNCKIMTVKALNKTTSLAKASELLGINEKTIHLWMKQYNIVKRKVYIIKDENNNI